MLNMLSLKGDKRNVTLFLTLAIILVTFGQSLGAEMITHPSSSPTSLISNQNSLRSHDESITSKLTQVRHLLKSLLFDWNLGESEVKDSLARTFGRMRIMRQIIIPMTFFGGFLAALIIGIKITGVFNVILVTKVLMLQLALILGKMIYGLKDLFVSKHDHHPQPVYNVQPAEHHYYHQPSYIPSYGPSSYNPPPSYGPSSYNPPPSYGPPSYGSSYGNSYGSQSHASAYASSREDGLSSLQNSPQYRSPTSLTSSFHQPHSRFQQPQISPFSGIALQAPQQIQYSPQFNQPFTRLRNVETLDQRIFGENLIDGIPAPKASLSPQELTKVLSDAIAQVSSRTTQSPLMRAFQNR